MGERADAVTAGRRITRSMTAVMLRYVKRLFGMAGVQELMRLAGDDRSVAEITDIAEWSSLPDRARRRGVPVTASIGVAIGRHGDTYDTLVNGADMAMYQAKRLGRNGHVLADVGRDEPATPADAEGCRR